VVSLSWVKPAATKLHLNLMLCAPSAQYEEDQQETSSAANNQRQQHGNHGTAGLSFMNARQSDAVKDNFPNSNDESATERDDNKRAGRSFREANYPERSLK
jgi:hypothetical protein